MPAIITIKFCVPVGHKPGDYARLHGNGGSGDIDWDTPITDQVFDLFPNGAGIYGFGHAPFGHHRFGKAHAMRTAGFGHLPFGHHPFGKGTAVITATYKVSTGCGAYKFGFKCYDAAGNAHAGTPEEVEHIIHIAPAAPLSALKEVSYNPATDVLVLSA